MNARYQRSLRNSLMLGALLLVTAALTGCGVGLPTQPDVASTVAGERSAGSARSTDSGNPQEIADTDNPTGGGTGEIMPDGEIVVQSPSRFDNFKGAGHAYGHQKNKWSNRN